MVLTLLLSCTLFSPREAEDPIGSDFWVEPFSPGISVMNFVNSIERKSAANYSRTLTSNYSFVPYYPDTLGSGGLFENWDKNKEGEYANILFSEIQSPMLVLSAVQRDSTDSCAFFYYDYEFYGDSQAEGLILFYMVSDLSGVWSIERIEDLGGESSSWTKMRKDLYERNSGFN
ncbi:hypothetical protein JXA84_05695 [candidate division WOR-3 bacterium]|nr:hypothetical protein [candidate division WOR-3 bacterium]